MSAEQTACPVVEPWSYCTFLHPFRFDPATYDRILETVQAEAHKAMPVWQEHAFQNEDLLPHVARFVNITSEGTRDTRAKPTSHSWDMGTDVLRHSDWLAGSGTWIWTPPRSETAVEVQITEVNLTMFRVGLGFFRFSITPKSQGLATWHDFVYGFRFMDGGRSGRLRVLKKTGKDSWEEVVPGVIPGQALQRDNGRAFQFGELVRALEDRYVADRQPGVYIERQLIPYVGLFVRGVRSEDRKMILHRMKNFFKSGQGANATPHDLPEQGCGRTSCRCTSSIRKCEKRFGTYTSVRCRRCRSAPAPTRNASLCGRATTWRCSRACPRPMVPARSTTVSTFRSTAASVGACWGATGPGSQPS